MSGRMMMAIVLGGVGVRGHHGLAIEVNYEKKPIDQMRVSTLLKNNKRVAS
jgi:hypothetical protein